MAAVVIRVRLYRFCIHKFPMYSGFRRSSLRFRTAISGWNPQVVHFQTPTDGNDLDAPLSENDYPSVEFINRNPRNLVKMCLALKNKGFDLDSPRRQYWHKVFLEISSRHTTAYVRYFTGRDVITASTREWAIQKYLYSNTDVAAAINVGRVLARRCLESGIIHVHTWFNPDEDKSEKMVRFKKALEEGGVSLKEPNRLYPVRPWH